MVAPLRLLNLTYSFTALRRSSYEYTDYLQVVQDFVRIPNWSIFIRPQHEPTEGIQPSIIKHIGSVISQLAKSGEMGILLVEQYYDFAKELADHYIVMSRGEIIKRGEGVNMDAENVRACLAL